MSLRFDFLPPCPFYTLLDLYCPACGSTRSVNALLSGDIFAALRYNLMIPFLILLGAAFAAELGFRAFGKRTVIVPRSNIFLFGCIGFFLAYYVVRNIV